jgi:sulfatase maturation enzyme AslB (radical SAM superfamily)
MLPVLSTASQPRKLPGALATAVSPRFESGFYAEERDSAHCFRWMAPAGNLAFDPEPEPRFLEMFVLSEFHDLSQELETVTGDSRRETLIHGWDRLSIPLPAGAMGVELRASKPFPAACHPGDPRTLAVRLGSVYVHADRERHRHIRDQHENAVRNRREMLAGAAVLESFPTNLGIDMYGACNIKPPCVYCEWDAAKLSEGDNVDTPFTAATLTGYGEFFDHSGNLTNCSIGEPFMMKEIDGVLDLFGERGKVLEVSTNGQVLTERNIRRLLGRDVHLYVSLDAATAETYACLRNDKFERILANLRRLIAAKGGNGRPPFVYLIFMPMKVNLHEADAFVELCAELGADALILRPLNDFPATTLDWHRAGHHFSYQEQILPVATLARVSGRIAGLCERRDVVFYDQMDFGGAMAELFAKEHSAARREAVAPPQAAAPVPAAPVPAADLAEEAAGAAEDLRSAARPSLGEDREPLCVEPWQSLYVLRRGVYPCCYGVEPIAEMTDYREAWNSPRMQEIRTDLAAGRLHGYCARSTSCPIVRKAVARGARLESAAPRSLRQRLAAFAARLMGRD